MPQSKFAQVALATGLLILAAFLLYRSTWTEEQRLILSDASLKGKILYKGKAVPYAMVILIDGKTSATGSADAQGNYFVQYAPVGKVQVGVNTNAGRGMMMSAVMSAANEKDGAVKPKFVDLPTKYFNPESSGLVAEVTDSQEATIFDIVIE